jgi:hypothetical protein
MEPPGPEPITPEGGLPRVRTGVWTIPVLLVLVFLGWATGYVPLVFNHPMYIAGSVADENGVPLHGVTMGITTRTFVLTRGSHSRLERRKAVINGSFRIMCPSCRSISLRFFKEGHYDETLEIAPDSKDLLRLHVHRNVQMVLERTGPIPHLEQYRGILRFSAHGIETVLPVGSGSETTGVSAARLVEQWGSSAKAAAPGPLYVSLQAEVDQQGRVAAERGPGGVDGRIDAATAPRSAGYPTGVVLDFSRAQGGVVLYGPSQGRGGSGGRSRVFRRMRTAPAHGYRERVSLDPSRGGGYYFFCTVAGQYGKGWITTPQLFQWKGRRIVFGNIVLRLNPDGSRNVASLD